MFHAGHILRLVADVFKRTQQSLFGHKPRPLTIFKVRNEVFSISQVSSQEQKLKIIDKLLVSASGAGKLAIHARRSV